MPRLLRTKTLPTVVDPLAIQLIPPGPPKSKSCRDVGLPPTPYDWLLLGTGAQSVLAENTDPAADKADTEAMGLNTNSSTKTRGEFIMWVVLLHTALNMQIPPAVVYPWLNRI